MVKPAASSQQQVLAALQRSKQVEAAPAAAGALAGGAVQVDHKAGAGILLGKAAGHDAHHALMPAAALQHQRAAVAVGQVGDHLLRLGVDGLLHVLALAVQSAQLTGHALRLRRIGTQQQLRRLVGGAHAARRVDAGRQHEADLHGGDLPAGQAGLLQKGVEPDKIGVVDGGKAPGHDGTVLAGHLHHVGHGADGGQRAVAGKQGLLPVRPAQSQHQLQRHTAAGQMLEGIAAVGPVGVHHRGGMGQRLLALVVVGDDHIHAQRVGEVHLLHAGDAAVHGDQQAGALAVQVLDGITAQSVAILDAAGI